MNTLRIDKLQKPRPLALLWLFVGLQMNLRLFAQYPEWDTHSDIVPPNAGDQQTASLALDVDLDGTDDFVITEGTAFPSVTWTSSPLAGTIPSCGFLKT